LIVVDTSALFAILQHESEGLRCLDIIDRADRRLIGAPTKFELLMEVSRFPDGQATASAMIASLGIEIAPWTDALADIAAAAFLRFGKGRHRAGLNFGDCMTYALASSLDAPLLFKGGDFALTDIRSAA
jgi:ribonuclease VapC